MFSLRIDLAKIKLYICRYWEITVNFNANKESCPFFFFFSTLYMSKKTTKKIVFDEQFSLDNQTK